MDQKEFSSAISVALSKNQSSTRESLRTFASVQAGSGRDSKKPVYVAATAKRVAAFVADEILRVLAFVPWWIVMGARELSMATVWQTWEWFALCYAFHFFARIVCLKVLQATPGKFLFGLRLIGRDHRELTWAQCLLRTFTDDISAVLGLATRILVFLRFDRTHLSDWIAETRVVQFVPRSRFPHRRWALTIILFVITAMNGLQASVVWLNSMAVSPSSVTLDQ